MTRLAALLTLALLAGCTSKSTVDAGVVMNGRCRCDGDALCVQQVSNAGARPVACVTTAQNQPSCAALATATRSCWPSPTVSGLCLCSGSDSLADNR